MIPLPGLFLILTIHRKPDITRTFLEKTSYFFFQHFIFFIAKTIHISATKFVYYTKFMQFVFNIKRGRRPAARKPCGGACLSKIRTKWTDPLRSTSRKVRFVRRHLMSTWAVSMAVRPGMDSSTVLRRSCTLSVRGMRPLRKWNHVVHKARLQQIPQVGARLC